MRVPTSSLLGSATLARGGKDEAPSGRCWTQDDGWTGNRADGQLGTRQLSPNAAEGRTPTRSALARVPHRRSVHLPCPGLPPFTVDALLNVHLACPGVKSRMKMP